MKESGEYPDGRTPNAAAHAAHAVSTLAATSDGNESTRGLGGPSRTRAGALIALLTVAILIGARHYLPGLLGAAILYVLCAPVYRRLVPRVGTSLAALVVTLGVAMIFVIPAVWVAAAAIEQAPAALSSVVQSGAFARLSVLQIGPLDVGAQLSRMGEMLATGASRQAVALVGGITRAILNLFIAAVGLYYLLQSADRLWNRVRPVIPFSSAGADRLRERFGLVTEATILGILATGLAQGATVGIAFWAVGLPNPVVWGAVTAAVSIFPILGSSLVWGPGVLVLLANGRYTAAVVLGLVGIVIASNIDNVLRPVLYRRVSGVHPVATLVGAFAGVELMGITGLLMGPLAISYLFELLNLYKTEFGAPISPV